MEFAILGPLEARVDGKPISLGGLRQQKALTVLLLDAGHVVSRDRLIEAVWGEDPPSSVQVQVQIVVSALRRALRAGGAARDVILTRSAGYQLDLDGDELDARVFARRVAEGQAAAATGQVELAVERYRAGLAVWRGPALAGMTEGRVFEAAAGGLEEQRIGALEACIALELELGRHGDLLGELARLAAEHPFRERLSAQLMLALYRSGRQTEALMVYRDARELLTEELGIEPGPELRGLQQAILAGNRSLDLPERAPGPVPVGARAHSRQVQPAQLPADLAEFTGRADALERLGKLLPGVGDTDSVPMVAVITGAAGVGKTAVAIHFAHQVAGRFPDGQLYVNLNGYAPTPPISPLRALTQLLHSLGVDADKIPVDVDAAAGLYRSLLAGRRLLVVLDNAREAEQVRPLLPGGSGCMVLVTSRDRLTGLVATHSVRRVPLSVLAKDEAVTLLARILGHDRVSAQPDAVLALAEACGHLPLALRIAAANLTCYPDEPIADHVVALREGDRLAELSVEGDPQAAVLTTFDRSYESLAADARRLFRLLGLVPGPDFTARAAAALAAVPPDDAERLLDRLADGHLLEPRPDGRYAFHDLLRLYARQRAEREDAEPARKAAVERLLGWYVGAVDAAATLAYPHLLRLPAPAPAGLPAVRFDDHTEALAWLDAERANLVTAIVHAARHGPRSSAWILADALRGYFWLRRLTVDALAVGDAGLAAAVVDGDLRAQAASRFMLGDAHQAIGNYSLTIEHYTIALALAREDGWLEGEAATLGNLGNVYGDMGSLREAAEHYAQALELDRRLGRREGQALTVCNLGVTYRELGRLDEAAEHYLHGLELQEALDSLSGVALIVGNLGDVYRELGRLDEAAAALTRSLGLMRELGDRYGEAYVLQSMAATHRDAGRLDEALEAAKAAVVLANEVDDPRTEAEACNTLGSIHLLLGDTARALDLYGRALRLARDTGTRFPETGALLGLAATQRRRGCLDEARAHAEDALAIAGDAGYQVLEGQARTALAAVLLARGEREAAVETAREALAVHRRTGHRLGEARTLVILGDALRQAGVLGADGAAALWRDAAALFAAIGNPEAERLNALTAGAEPAT